MTLAGTWTGIIPDMDERPSFPLPTNGWNPTKRSQLARISGVLHATLTEAGARAWLGDDYRHTLWPEGIRVRFNPTQLVGPDNEVLASEGEVLTFAGGGFLARDDTPIGLPGEWVTSLQSTLKGIPRKPKS